MNPVKSSGEVAVKEVQQEHKPMLSKQTIKLIVCVTLVAASIIVASTVHNAVAQAMAAEFGLGALALSPVKINDGDEVDLPKKAARLAAMNVVERIEQGLGQEVEAPQE